MYVTVCALVMSNNIDKYKLFIAAVVRKLNVNSNLLYLNNISVVVYHIYSNILKVAAFQFTFLIRVHNCFLHV